MSRNIKDNRDMRILERRKQSLQVSRKTEACLKQRSC